MYWNDLSHPVGEGLIWEHREHVHNNPLLTNETVLKIIKLYSGEEEDRHPNYTYFLCVDSYAQWRTEWLKLL